MSSYAAQPQARPKSVRTAVTLIWIRIALGVLSVVVAFATGNATATASGSSETAAGVAAVIGIVFALLIGVGLPALLAIFIAKGANWARIVYTVFAVIGLLVGLLTVFAGDLLVILVNVASLALTVAILVFLFRPDANDYFRR